MNVAGNGQRPKYRVSLLGPVAEVLKNIRDQAILAGNEAEIVAALRIIYERLRQDPLGFGEPLYRLPAMKMLVCVGAVSPISIGFGVHEDKALVVIRHASYMGTP